jgi:RND family efflux transporter MFP subunit
MSNGKSIFRSVFSLKVIFPIIVILLAGAGAWAIVKSAPKAKKRQPAVIRPTVEILKLNRETHQVWVPVMGTVDAAQEINLKARVSGEVISISRSFVPGGFFKKGERIITISPEDYQLALSQVQAEVATAEYELKLEQGYQNVSAREWNLLKGSGKLQEGDSDLALRKPHLEKAKAGLRSARAKLRKAELDLARTRITAPFAAMVEEKSVDIGASISTSDSLATLVGTDEFWIKASVSVDRLAWIDVPVGNQSQGASVRIAMGGTEREGRVIRLLPSLESEGRMARLLITVSDPLNLNGVAGVKPLLLGSYVSMQVDGGSLGNVFSIPRSALHDNNQVWLLNTENKLEIRMVEPVWRDATTVLFEEGFKEGERLITSDIAAPLQGMDLQTMEEASKAARGQSKDMNKGQSNG